MEQIKKVQQVKVWNTTDGKSFDDKGKAERHQDELNLVSFFRSAVDGDEATAIRVAQTIIDDPEGFRECAGVVLRKPRVKPDKSGGAKKAA